MDWFNNLKEVAVSKAIDAGKYINKAATNSRRRRSDDGESDYYDEEDDYGEESKDNGGSPSTKLIKAKVELRLIIK